MGITVGLLAHVDAGKTTLAEQILYYTGALRSPGTVDRGTSVLDCATLERRRGISIFSDQAPFFWDGREYHLLDTPGHADFSGEMERAIAVMDVAVLVISSVEGLQSHTRTVWRLLRDHHIPTMLFFNKTDRAGSDVPGLRTKLECAWGACPDFSSLVHGIPSEALIECLAELDEALLEKYLSETLDFKLLIPFTRNLFLTEQVFPSFGGSARTGEGVEELLRALSLFTVEKGQSDVPFQGICYKVRHDKSGRVVFLKVLEGTLRPKTAFNGPEGLEKCNELRQYFGGKSAPLDKAKPGDLCAVTGIQAVHPGDIVGDMPKRSGTFHLQPLLMSSVEFDKSIPPKTMLSYFQELEDEEPLLGVRWNEQAHQLQVRIMGRIQLEVLAELVQTRFGVAVQFGPCEILYRESLLSPVIGCGHFEPLRHYAEVHLQLSPSPRGTGITFESRCPTDNLAVSWQNQIRSIVLKLGPVGILTGSPLTDVRITLLAGRAHLSIRKGAIFWKLSEGPSARG